MASEPTAATARVCNACGHLAVNHERVALGHRRPCSWPGCQCANLDSSDPLAGADCGICGDTADNFHVSDDLWERVGLGHVQACFKCFRIAAWHAGVRPDCNWEVSLA